MIDGWFEGKVIKLLELKEKKKTLREREESEVGGK